MARINVEDEWFSDPRRARLTKLLGCQFKADGVMLLAWFLSQKYWIKKELIPEHAWSASEMPDELFTCGLAERRESGIYVRGSDRHFAWYTSKVEAGKSGGAKSAQARASKVKQVQAESSTHQAESSTAQADSSESNPLTLALALSLTQKQIQEKQENVFCENSENKFQALPQPQSTPGGNKPLGDASKISQLVSEWGKTLQHFKIEKDPRFDEVAIARLAARYGHEKTKLAILGSRHEQKTESFDPGANLSIARLMNKPAIFEKLVNLGCQDKTKPTIRSTAHLK